MGQSAVRLNQHSKELPLIDVSGLFRHDPATRRSIGAQLGDAAQTIGFFRICGHGIAPRIIENAYAAAERFFRCPDEFKRRSYIGHSSNHRGYVPFSERGLYADETSRNYEAFDLGPMPPCGAERPASGQLLIGPNTWPDLENFRGPISDYLGQVFALGGVLCSALETFLGLPAGAMTQQMTEPVAQLRLLHYVRAHDAISHRSVNMGAHTDYECLTLLHTRNPGLQVMTQEDEWIDVPVDPEVFVVNIGDMLEAWSNGIFRSTPHRVLNLSPERYSMPYFVAANYDTVIAPFPQLVTAERPARYAPFTAGAHMERMLRRDFPYLRNRQAQCDAAEHSPPGGPYSNPFENRIRTES